MERCRKGYQKRKGGRRGIREGKEREGIHQDRDVFMQPSNIPQLIFLV